MRSDPSAPIGVFDSGVGGLSVLLQIRKRLPNEPLLYAADTAHLPYGDKTPAYVRRRVEYVAQRLVDEGAKALVVACNTATAAAVEALRERYDLPIIGMEPGIKPAVLSSRSGVVGVLATEATARSERLQRLIAQYGGKAKILVQPAPGLVGQVERHALDTPETARLLRGYLQPLLEAGADTLVLGCTHYPFLQPLIERLSENRLSIIETGVAVAQRVADQLQQHQLLSSKPSQENTRILCGSDDTNQWESIIRLWPHPFSLAPLP